MSRFDRKSCASSPAPPAASARRSRCASPPKAASPVIADLNLDAANATAKEIKAKGWRRLRRRHERRPTRPRSRRASPTSMAKYGKIDMLVSNAGIQIVKPLVDFPFADWKKLLSIHLDGAFLTTKACLKHMYAAKYGRVVYMGSVHSKEASKLKAPYVTAKHGLIGLAKVLAKEGAEYNVARQRGLPGLRAHAAGRQADPRAGQGARHHRGRGDQERDAEGHGRRRVHHHRRRGRRGAVLRRRVAATR